MYNSCKKVKEEKMNHGKQSSLIKEKKDQLANASNTQVDVKTRVSRKRIQTLAAKERDCNLNKKNVHVSATVTQSEGSTSKQEQEQHRPLNFSTLTQKKTMDEVVSRKTQDLKRKFTIPTSTNSEEYGNFNKNLVEERGKMRKFSAVSIDSFIEINKEHHDGETLDENEDEHDIEEQEEGDVNPIDIEGEENTNITEGAHAVPLA